MGDAAAGRSALGLLAAGVLLTAVFMAACSAPFAVVEPAIEWEKVLGGSGTDGGHSVQQTSDGGYIILGTSDSSGSGDVTGAVRGPGGDTRDLGPLFSMWAVKLDRTGAIQWQKLLGGEGNQYGESVEQTADGGYILLGSPWEFNNRGLRYTGSYATSQDVRVVKLDGAGEIQWQKSLNGTLGGSIGQTTDGGYILLGAAPGAREDNSGRSARDFDFWVVKLDGAGTVQWEKLYGGSSTDYGESVQQTTDGGYILLGASYSSASGDVKGANHNAMATGSEDVWVVKLDEEGAIEWEKLLGGGAFEASQWSYAIQQTADGGYILLTNSYSSESGDVTGKRHGYSSDYWVVKLDRTGATEWQKLLGGAGEEDGHSIRQTADGGYILLGESVNSSASGDVDGTNHGGEDYWAVKLNGAGAIEWEKLLGGTGNDTASSIRQTVDGGYILLGESDSSASGNVKGAGHGRQDIWVVKLTG